MTWKLLKAKRETPCCKQRVRIVLIAPGYQERRCDLCKRTNVFVLEQMAKLPGTLRLRWLTDAEVAELLELLEPADD